MILIRPDEDLLKICRRIAEDDRTLEQWMSTESSDEFQIGEYCGGFDADEGEFCFEMRIDGTEYWFQFSLEQALEIAEGRAVELEARVADT